VACLSAGQLYVQSRWCRPLLGWRLYNVVSRYAPSYLLRVVNIGADTVRIVFALTDLLHCRQAEQKA
jgi:hypothetical protein